MAIKNIDKDFLDYGIKTRDMQLIESFSIENKVDFDWVKEYMLKAYQEEKNETDRDLDIDGVKKIIKKALKKL
ncbi:MAG: hypothetical protein Q4Q06_04285 [Bacteroidota bacterium]|nr:hypothetical protein [Bacteroidota bacterium]